MRCTARWQRRRKARASGGRGLVLQRPVGCRSDSALSVLPARTPPGDYVLTVADKSFRGPPAAGAGDAETAGTLLTNLPAVSLPLTVLPPVG